MHRSALAAPVLTLLLAAGACAAQDVRGADAPTTAGPTETVSTGPTELVASPAPPTESAAQRGRFGDRVTYSDGLAMVISPGKAYEPSPYVTEVAGTPMAFQVTLTNGSDASIPGGAFEVRVLSGAVEGVPIEDSDKNVMTGLENKLSKDDEITFWLGFWVADPDDVSMVVRPNEAYPLLTLGR